jgi:hypothetical protein
MQLSEVFPAEALRAKFAQPVMIKHMGRSQLAEISAQKPKSMIEMGGGAWDRYVQANPGCNPLALASYFQREDPKLYLGMERHIQAKVLHDISFTVARVDDETLTNKCAGELLLAVTYPGVLRISDITFADVYKPIPERTRRYQFQDFKGLGLLPALIENCVEYCQDNNIARITLAAADVDLMTLFKRYGFEVEDTPAGRMALQTQIGIPMARAV